MTEFTERSVNGHVASRMVHRRLELGLTQVEVANSIGVTFQQYQKYERGTNRVTAGRLYLLADVFDTNVSYFFQEFGAVEDSRDLLTVGDVRSQQSARLARDFKSIPSRATRQAILNMLRMLHPGR